MIVRNAAVTAAVLAELNTIADTAAFLVGDGEKPAAAGWQGERGTSEFVPYAVLWPIPGGTLDGSLGQPDSDAVTDYQVTAVGATREQAEVVADLVRAGLVRAQLDIDDRGVISVTCDEFGGAVPDRSVEPPVFMVADRYCVSTDS